MDKSFKISNNLEKKNITDNVIKVKKENLCKNKKLIILLITLCLFLFVFFICYNKKSDTKEIRNDDNNSTEIEKGNITFKDISFLNIGVGENIYFTNIDIFNNYLFYNKKFFDFNGNVVFDASDYDYVDFDNDYNYIIVGKDNNQVVLDDKFNIIVPQGEYSADIESADYIRLFFYNKHIYSVFDVKNNRMYENYNYVKYINDYLILIKKNGNNEFEVLNLGEQSGYNQNKFNIYNLASARSFNNEYIIISKTIDGKEKYGVVDLEFNEFIPFNYDYIDNINDKYLLLEFETQAKLITIDKKELLNLNNKNLKLVWAEEKSIEVVTSNDLTKPYNNNRTFEYYDLDLNLLYKYSDVGSIVGYNVEYLSENVYLFYSIDKCFYFDSKQNKKITDNSFCNYLNRKSDKYIIKEEKTGEILYDIKFKPIFKQHYDKIILYDNFCLIKIDNKYYVYSFDEKKLLEKSFDYYYSFEEDNSIILVTQNKEDEKHFNSYYYFKYEK